MSQAPAPDRPRSIERWPARFRLTDRACVLGVVAALLSSLLPLLGDLHWVLDNAGAAAPLLLGCCAAFALVAALQRRTKSAVLVGLAVLVQAAHIVALMSVTAPALRGPTLSWLVANVHTANRRYDELMALIAARKPDLVGLVETDQRWVDAIDRPLSAYRYRELHPRADNFGVALYSQVPLHGAGLRDLGGTPVVGASVAVGSIEVDLLLVHLLPPFNGTYARARDQQLRAIGRLRPRSGAGLVVAGDLNVTPYSVHFRRNLEAQGLRRAGGLGGTFPASWPLPLRVPIDHALVAGAVGVRVAVDRHIHSDHLPLLIRMAQAADRP